MCVDKSGDLKLATNTLSLPWLGVFTLTHNVHIATQTENATTFHFTRESRVCVFVRARSHDFAHSIQSAPSAQ